MTSDAEKFGLGLVCGIGLMTIIMVAFTTPTCSWQADAIKHKAAHYNSETGYFEWNDTSK